MLTMRNTSFVCGVIITLFLTFGACKSSKDNNVVANDTTKVVRVNNQKFFETMRPYLEEGFAIRMVPSGNSMLPTIKNNTDVVVIKAPRKVEKQDIVLAEIEKGHYVMHRVVDIQGQKLTLKGDNNKSTESARVGDVMAKVMTIMIDEVNNEDDKVVEVDTLAEYGKIPRFRLDFHDNSVLMVDTMRNVVDMQHVLTFNETALLVWNAVKDRPSFSIEDMADAITQCYNIDRNTARKDCVPLLQVWMKCGLVEKKVTLP